MNLPKNIRFIRGTGAHKYTAIFSDGRRVHFGHAGYEQYKDSVPRRLGGGLWSHRDHGDKERRARYRARAGASRCKNGQRCIDVKFSPAWFSYYFLW
jgi:hypothetical protein